MKDDIDHLDNNESKITEKPLGAVATRLNVHATINMLLCEVTEESFVAGVKDLILTRSDINKVNADGRNALYVAAENGNAGAVRILLKYNADVTKVEKESGFSCLHAAALGTNVEVIEFLIDVGADIRAIDKCNRCKYIFQNFTIEYM